MTSKMRNAGSLARSAVFLLSTHLVALAFFFAFRLVLFASTDYQFPPDIATDRALQSIAFVRGLWFDNVVACYVLLLPLVALWVGACLGRTPRWLSRAAAAYLIVMYSLCFAITAANIPYFAYFFKPINSSILNWAEYVGTTAGMVFGESAYYLPMALGVASIAAFAYIVTSLERRCFEGRDNASAPPSWRLRAIRLVAGAVMVGLCLFGIRGRRGYNPIKVSQAYYCGDAFLNQLGVNPVFNLLTSAIDDGRKENRLLHLIGEKRATDRVRQMLGRNGIEGISPIAQRVTAKGKPTRQNVVVILMESMSANLMGTFGNKQGLTPFLDSLYSESLSFSHFYSSGIHTNHGLYSSLYSFPAMMKRNMMKGTVIPTYSGLPTVLKDNGYHTSFFMTHESQYDNMNAFFRTNGFDDIYSQENYPQDKVVNGFGVQDDFLFSYALPVLDRQAQSGQPFFSVLLTISNHPPYIVPPTFHPHSADVEHQIVEYADWAVGQFMRQAMARPWADNTLFVLLGDHGKLVGTPECESPQSYNHIPLIIHGKGIEPRIVDDYGGQVDLAPTLLGLLNVSYVQNNFGVDLLQSRRPCMYFTADNLIGVRDASHLYLFIPETRQEFKYMDEGGRMRRTNEDSKTFNSMKEYVFSMLQCAESLTMRQLTLDRKRK